MAVNHVSEHIDGLGSLTNTFFCCYFNQTYRIRGIRPVPVMVRDVALAGKGLFALFRIYLHFLPFFGREIQKVLK